MSFETHNTAPISAIGTCLQGYVTSDYSNIVRVFGEPTECDGYKVDAEWVIQFSDGKIATIYNWKNGKNYCGDDGLDPEDIKEWHIGGKSTKVVSRIQKLLSDPWPVFDEIRQAAALE